MSEFFSFIDQSHSFNSKQIGRHILPALIILKLSLFGKNNLWKMEVLQIFGSWDQEINSCSIQKISSNHKFILKMQQILGSHELNPLSASLNLYQHTKNQFTPSVDFWDTVNLSCPLSDWPHTHFLTMIPIFVNLYQHAKNQFIPPVHS